MTLTELLQEVYTLTARPDLVNETTSALRSSTLKLHQIDYFYKDIDEVVTSWSAGDYNRQILYKEQYPLWRSLKYLRKYSTDTSGKGYAGAFLNIIDPLQVLDLYNVAKTDVCYIAGLSLNIRSSTKDNYFLLGYYKNPDITLTGFNSWIAVDHPYAIIYDAVATIFRLIGKQEDENSSRLLALEQRKLLISSNIIINGM